jgi:hypothetical protein
MPIRLVSVPTDWENEIAAWAAQAVTLTDMAWYPSSANTMVGNRTNLASPGGVGGAIAANKTFKVFRKTLGGYNPHTVSDAISYTRLYNSTKAVSIASLSLSVPKESSTYTSEHGNPLANYSYDANDVVFAQVEGDIASADHHCFGLFEAQIVDR